MPDEPLIPPHGRYRKLKSFQIAQLAYDLTVLFVDRYIDKRSRICDQMVQAAGRVLRRDRSPAGLGCVVNRCVLYYANVRKRDIKNGECI